MLRDQEAERANTDNDDSMSIERFACPQWVICIGDAIGFLVVAALLLKEVVAHNVKKRVVYDNGLIDAFSEASRSLRIVHTPNYVYYGQAE